MAKSKRKIPKKKPKAPKKVAKKKAVLETGIPKTRAVGKRKDKTAPVDGIPQKIAGEKKVPKKKGKDLKPRDNGKHPGGRPPKHDWNEVNKWMIKYLVKTQIPILSEFAWQVNIHSKFLYAIPELRDSIKRMMDKKEAMLEQGALFKRIDTGMAVFSLKQMGWSDKAELNISGHIDFRQELNKVDEITDVKEKTKALSNVLYLGSQGA